VQAGGVKGTVEIVEPTAAERAIARRSAESRATVPHLELSADVDMGACMQVVGDSIPAAVLRAAALALRDHPRANGAYRDGRFELYSRVNVGLVLPSSEDLVTATVFDADRKQLAELAAEITSLSARADELTPPQRSGSTFTVWLAEGVRSVSPIIPTPNAGALGVGEVREAAVVREGVIVSGHLMALTLACDHRILYEPQAARFLARITELLERAEL
jgi:pyruvate dehydrogenase E2 component (dihydrolipoamide acetyltransferase)